MVRNVARRALGRLDRHRLQIDRHCDMRHAAIAERAAARELGHVLNVARAHDAVVIDARIRKQLVELDILLRIGADQIVVLKTGDGEHRLTVELRVVEPVEQVDAAGPGGRQADAEAAGPLGVAAGHEGGGLFVTHLHEADRIEMGAQRLHDAVDAVARQPEHDLDTPVDQGVHEHVRGSSRHGRLRRDRDVKQLVADRRGSGTRMEPRRCRTAPQVSPR
jgi:hypothetical protein